MGESGGDAVDLILEQWRRARPDLDLSAVGVFGRMLRVTALVEAVADSVAARHHLRRGEFDVLTALRQSGPPSTLIPSELSARLMVSRGAMTNRLDRLEAAGLVERRLDPTDRRSFQVTLTGKGRETVDAALAEYAPRLTRILSSLPTRETQTLERSLRTLLRTLGPPA